jgi:hypothetical protein
VRHSAVIVWAALGCGRIDFDSRPGLLSDALSDAAPCNISISCQNGETFSCPGGGCYAVCHDPDIWNSQNSRCTSAGLHLATIQDATEDACIEAHLTLQWYWIGLVQANTATTPTADWGWSTGEPFVYTNWWTAPGHVNPDDNDDIENGYEQCGWKAGPPAAGVPFWDDASCGNANPGGVCER